jgi:hypothetical protein
MRNRFQINEEIILALVGNNGGTFETEAEVRAYFQRDNLRNVFPGGRMLPQASLDELAELVIAYRETSARFLWDVADFEE